MLKNMTGFEVSIQEIKEGKVNHYNSVEDMFKHIGYNRQTSLNNKKTSTHYV